MSHRKNLHVALCSGGVDSVTTTHKIMEEKGIGDVVVYLDTQTGLKENREYISELCKDYGWHFWTLQTNVSYNKLVKENLFPGPSRHNIMYRSLKERQISKLATFVLAGDGSATMNVYTGVRTDESARRFKNVTPKQEGENGRWIWHAPIYDYSKEDCLDYIDKHNIRENPLWDTLGRSGDCYCGCFGNREELLDLEVVGETERLESIIELEEYLSENNECEDNKCLWGWGSLEDSETQREMEGEIGLLCSSCGVDKPPIDFDYVDAESSKRSEPVRLSPEGFDGFVELSGRFVAYANEKYPDLPIELATGILLYTEAEFDAIT